MSRYSLSKVSNAIYKLSNIVVFCTLLAASACSDKHDSVNQKEYVAAQFIDMGEVKCVSVIITFIPSELDVPKFISDENNIFKVYSIPKYGFFLKHQINEKIYLLSREKCSRLIAFQNLVEKQISLNKFNYVRSIYFLEKNERVELLKSLNKSTVVNQ